MSLRVTSLELRDFRNYPSYKVDDLAVLNVLVGPNAVGKTNLLEALQLLTSTTSFRNPKNAHLIRIGAEAAFAQAHVEGDGRILDVSLAVQDGKRAFNLNGKRKAPADLRGLVPSVTFSPDDLYLVKGAHAQRRDALDALGSQLSKNYAAVRNDYQKMVRQKNRYLKQDATDDYLVAINEVLATVGAQLYVMRTQLVEEFSNHLASAYASISGSKESVRMTYVPSWMKDEWSDDELREAPKLSRSAVRDALLEAMSARASREHERRLSLFGPHADHVNFFIRDLGAQRFASQGQQRSLVLACKLAEVALIEQRLGQLPIMLLDDVMSELDETRRSELMQVINQGIQVFVTTTTLDYFTNDVLKQARVVEMRNPSDGGNDTREAV